MLKRHQNVFDYIKSNFDTSARILDIGCDKGHLLNELFLNGYNNLDYVDIKDSIEYSLVKNAEKLKLVDLNKFPLPYEDESFDVVCALQILEHLENPHQFKRECLRVLRPGGKLVISIPYGHNLASKIRFFLRGNVCRWEKGGDHITFLTKNIFFKIFLQDFKLCQETHSQGNLTDYRLHIILPDFQPLNKLFGRNVYYFLERKQHNCAEQNSGRIGSVCYFGHYVPDYPRNRVLIGGWKKNHYKVIECNTTYYNWKKYFDLFKKFRLNGKGCDILFIAYPGHDLVWFSKILTQKPIIFEPSFSYYDSYVYDRKLCSKRSIKALYYFCLDWFCARLADYVILENSALIDYFVNTFKLPREKFLRVIMSADDEIRPQEQKKNDDEFLVHFHGSFIPFHGVEYIIRAAKLLENEKDIKFNVIGGGQTTEKIKMLLEELKLTNLNFFGKRIPYQELAGFIAKADVCLGLFGDSPRSEKVLTNKIFESIMMKKPVITANFQVMRELYADNKNIIFCNKADEKDLADKIMLLKNNIELRNKIAENGYNLFTTSLNPKVVVGQMMQELEKNLCAG